MPYRVQLAALLLIASPTWAQPAPVQPAELAALPAPDSGTELWQTVGDGPAQSRRLTLLPGLDTPQMAIPLDLPGPGYVDVRWPEDLETGTRPAIALVDAQGSRPLSGPLRVGIPDSARLDVDISALGAPADLQLEYWPELDLTEPNDDPLLAWPVRLRRTESAVLFPAGDSDYFAFDLDEAATVLTQIQSPGAAPQIAYIDPDTGATLSGNALADLDAGHWVLRLSAPEAETGTPQGAPRAVSFTLLSQPAPGAGTPAAPLDLRVGQPNPVPLGLQTAEFHVEIAEAGFYTLQAHRLGGAFRFALADADGEVRSGQHHHLAPGIYTLTVSEMGFTGQPGFVTAWRTALSDDGEPNDFMSAAADYRGDDAIPVRLQDERDIDWFAYTPTASGDLSFRAERPDGSCDQLQLRRPKSEGDEDLPYLPFAADIYGPIAVEAGERLLFKAVCTFPPGGQVLTLWPHVRAGSDTNTGSDGESPVYVIGIEMGETTDFAMERLAEESGTRYIPASEADDVSIQIEEISRTELGRGRTPWMVYLLLLIGLAVAVIGVGYWQVRRSRLSVDITD